MRRWSLTLFAMVALSPSAWAGLDLTWNDCALESNTSFINYTDCNIATKTIRLYSSFKTPVAVSKFIAADLVYDLQEEDVPQLEPFWRFDDAASGGCNSSGIVFRVDADAFGHCGGEVNAWGPMGQSAVLVYTVFVNGAGGSNRGRFLCSIARSTDNSVALEPGVNYFMNYILLSSLRRSTCPGCTGKVDMAWNSAALYDSSGATVVVVNGPDKVGNVVGINTLTDPVRKMSWSRLKSLYR
jgi:hypothetical protein